MGKHCLHKVDYETLLFEMNVFLPGSCLPNYGITKIVR